MKYNKWRGAINGGLFVYFDPNDVNVSKFAYVRAKLYLWKRKKVLKQCENSKSGRSDIFFGKNKRRAPFIQDLRVLKKWTMNKIYPCYNE